MFKNFEKSIADVIAANNRITNDRIEKLLLKEETCEIFTFRRNKLSRMKNLMKNFAGINFHGEPLSKDFTGIKKARI